MPNVRHLGHYGNFRKLSFSVRNFLEVSFLTFLTDEALNLLGSLNYFDQVGHKILRNRYLKTNFGNKEIRAFAPTF